MGELCKLASSGDFKIIWDKNNDAEVEAAQDSFDSLIESGYSAYSVKKDGSKGEKITEFDADAEKIIMVPTIVGG